MRGLKIIPVFVVLLLCTYVGILFVEANRDTVIVQFGSHQTPPTALGLVVLTSVLIGMLVSGTLCSIELLVLVMQNRKLRRRLPVPPSRSGASENTGSFNLEPFEKTGEIGGGGGSVPPDGNRFTPL